MAEPAPIIELQSARLDTGFAVSLTVAPGEIIGLNGGAPMLEALVGLRPLTSGRATIAGHDVELESLAARRVSGFLPPLCALPEAMGMHDFLRYIASMFGMTAESTTVRLSEIMAELDIAHLAQRQVNGLSVEDRLRVGLAQALVGSPNALLLIGPEPADADEDDVLDTLDHVKKLADEQHMAVLIAAPTDSAFGSICTRWAGEDGDA